jgi:hypothetical protein
MLLCGAVPLRLGSFELQARPFAGLHLVACLLLACGYPKPPVAWTGEQAGPQASTPPPVPPHPPLPPPPPPPPKCEDLAENCSANPETRLYVGDSGAWFTPPQGWHYARTAAGSIAVHPEGGAFMVLKPSPDPSDFAPALEALVNEQGVTGFKVSKLKPRLKKAEQSLPAAEGTVDLWEVDQKEPLALGDKGTGTLLVLVGKPAPEHTLLGIGFVTEALAESDAPKIMQAVQTLRSKP